MNLELKPYYVQLVMRFDVQFRVAIAMGQREMAERKENPIIVNP